MEVKLLASTPHAEELICLGARNDYMANWVGDAEFEEAMKGVKGESITEKKKTLMTHLMKHGHWGPFEHPSFTFAVSGISRSCMAQITRHRLASFDVQSMRYVKFDMEDGQEPDDLCISIPEMTDSGICGRSAKFTDYWAKADKEDILNKRQELYWESIESSYKTYNELLKLGVAPENARMVLPIGTKINLVVSLNLRSLLHIVDMRGEADAQWEIREMTNEMIDLAQQECPITFDIFMDKMKGRKNRLAP